jgi:hypothetical protein
VYNCTTVPLCRLKYVHTNTPFSDFYTHLFNRTYKFTCFCKAAARRRFVPVHCFLQVNAESLCKHMTHHISEHYRVLLATPYLQPYVGHSVEWGIAEGVHMYGDLQVCVYVYVCVYVIVCHLYCV